MEGYTGMKGYAVSLRHLSPQQIGVQSAHAIVEYSIAHNGLVYKKWAEEHKTLCFLVAHSIKQMQYLKTELEHFGMNVSIFLEEDMGCETSMFFILPEFFYAKEFRDGVKAKQKAGEELSRLEKLIDFISQLKTA